MFETWHVSIYLLTYEETIFTHTVTFQFALSLRISSRHVLVYTKFLTTLMKTFNITLIYILVHIYQSLKLLH